MTAGKRIRTVASQRPAQYVDFDVLAAGGEDLRHRPLRERRLILERALSGLGSPIVLCQQTEDLVTAREWLRTLTAGGIEGLVIKDAAGTYPTREGQRPWWKYKSKATLDMGTDRMALLLWRPCLRRLGRSVAIASTLTTVLRATTHRSASTARCSGAPILGHRIFGRQGFR